VVCLCGVVEQAHRRSGLTNPGHAPEPTVRKCAGPIQQSKLWERRPIVPSSMSSSGLSFRRVQDLRIFSLPQQRSDVFTADANPTPRPAGILGYPATLRIGG
jgi:hypothetical protein